MGAPQAREQLFLQLKKKIGKDLGYQNDLAEVHGNRTHLAHLPVNHNWI